MYFIILNFNKQMNTIKAKINAYLFNLAISLIKELRIQNESKIKHIYMQFNIETNIVVPNTWGQHTMA